MKFTKKFSKLKIILLLIGIIFLCISGSFTLNFNVIEDPAYEFQANLYTIKHPIYGILPVQVDSTFYIPKLEYNWYLITQGKMPVIVFVHGFTADKNFFKGLAFEFVRRGFACVTITSRGDHGSGGILGLTYENEALTAVDYVEMLANAGFPFDIGRIGLIGHSMGAYSVTLAASKDSRINATVAIAGPIANMTRGAPIYPITNMTMIDPLLLTLLIGESGFNMHRITYFSPGLLPYLQYSGGYLWESFSGNAVIEGKVNGTNPKNYLNIIGTIDEVFSVFSAQEVLWYMGLKDPPYNIPDYLHVLRDYLYGDFNNGTARKLVTIPMTDHLFEPNHPVTIFESINWMEKSMKLTHPIYGSIEYLMYQVLFRDSTGEILRVSAPWFSMLGMAIVFLPLSSYLGNWLKSKYTEAKIAKEIEKKKMWFMFLIYGIAFCLISLITMPVIQALNIVPWTDFLGSNILHMVLVVQSVLFLPVLIALILYERWKFKENLEDFGLNPRAFPKSGIFGLALALIIFTILNIVITPTYFNSFITRPESFFEIFIYMLFALTVSVILSQGLIQSKLSRYSNVKLRLISRFLPAWKEFLLSSLVSGLIQGIGFGTIFSILLGSSSIIPIISSPLIFLGCIGVFFVLSLINNWLYRKTRNVLGLILFNSFMISWISTLLPAISGTLI